MNFKQNRLVVLYQPPPISNRYGRYWAWMHRVVLAHMGSMKPRSGSYHDPWASELDPVMQLPELKYINDSLSDIMDDRAVELFQHARSTGRRIYIMWSGGIDSTSVLTAFLKNISDYSILTVVYSEDSITENPSYWQNYILGKLDTAYVHDFKVSEEFFQRQGIVLTGDPADALFGPSMGMYSGLIASGKHQENFLDHTNLIAFAIERYGQQFIRDNDMQGFGRWYSTKVTNNLLEVKPADVTSVADWWWWHYINLKWETSIWRPLVRCKSSHSESLSEHTIADFVASTFFNTARFQQWSYSNRHRFIINNDVSTHKHEIKKYIYDFDHNDEYFNGKTKTMSLLNRNLKQFPVFVNWDWSSQPHGTEIEQEIVAKLEDYSG